MMKLKPSPDKIYSPIIGIYLIFVCFVFFAIPKSFVLIVPGDFREISSYMAPWKYQRLFLILISILFFLYCLFSQRLIITYKNLIFIIAALALSVFNTYGGEFSHYYSIVGILTTFSVFCVVNHHYPPKYLVNFVLVFCLMYLCQFLFYRIGGRVTGSFLDPNISGYYLFLTYVLVRYSKVNLLSPLFVLAGIMTFSRNFILAVFVFEFFKFGMVNRVSVMLISRIKTISLIVFSTFFVILGSFYIAGFSSYNDTIGATSSRLTNINDGSNYERAHANIDMLNRIIVNGDFIISGNGDKMDEKTKYRPHNAFLRAVYRYGLFVGLLCFYFYAKVTDRYLSNQLPLVLGCFCYYSILNDFVTGMDFLLILIVYHVNEYNIENTKLSHNNKIRFTRV